MCLSPGSLTRYVRPRGEQPDSFHSIQDLPNDRDKSKECAHLLLQDFRLPEVVAGPVAKHLLRRVALFFQLLFLQMCLCVFRARGIADRLHAVDIGIRDITQVFDVRTV